LSIREVVGAIGDWDLKLSPNTPQEILDRIDYWGHVAVFSGRIDITRYGDAALDRARYSGVIRGRSFEQGNNSISGGGLPLWLGDEDDKGDLIELPITITNQPLNNSISAVLPDSIQLGNVESIPGLYTGVHQYETPFGAVNYISSLYDAEWRVRPNFKLDVGKPAFLYGTEPTCAIVRRIPEGGVDMAQKVLPGQASLDADVEDFTTRVVLVVAPPEGEVISASADILPGLNPYKDFFGNPVKMTRLISDSQTTAENAPSVAQLQLNRFTSPREALDLSTQTHDLKGDVEVGGYIWVEDREAKLVDLNNQVKFKGETLYPMKLRVSEMSWPIVQGMSVGYRHWDGTWYDLTDYVEYESGNTTLVVGGYYRSLTGAGKFTNPTGSVPIIDTTTPAAPEFDPTGTFTATYNSEVDGSTLAEIVLAWNRPLNTDSSVITDGDYYELRWRTSDQGVYAATYGEMEAYANEDLTGTNQAPIEYNLGAWNFIRIAFGTEEFRIVNLTPGIPYEFQIRAVDTANPAHYSDWSDALIVQARPDTTAPNPPKPPELASNVLAVQVLHRLGTASVAGDYNLNSDLHHLNVYMGPEPTFEPDRTDGTNKIGDIPATIAQMRAETAVVKTFNVAETQAQWFKVTAVDGYGNESLPSVAVQATAELVSDAYITNLTVSKVTAGIMSAAWIMGGNFATATTGIRTGFDYTGFYAYNQINTKTFSVSAATGLVEIVGKIIAYDPVNGPGDRITIWPSFQYNAFNSFPTITFETSDASIPGYAFINAISQSSGTTLGLNSGPSAAGATSDHSTLLLQCDGWALQYNTYLPAALTVKGGRVSGDLTEVFMDFWDASGNNQGFYLIDQDFVEMRRHGTENAGNGECNVELYANGVRFLAAGIYAAEIRYSGSTPATGIVVSGRFASYGENEARMQVDGAAGNTFSMRDGGGADPIMDMTNFAARFVKNFVIEHPDDKDRWLVHGCTESPVPGLEYSGTIVLEKDYWAEVELPDYFESLAAEEGRQTSVFVQLPDDGSIYPYIPRAIASRPKNGKFRISTDAFAGTIISWRVFAHRKDVSFPVEPLRTEFARRGSGPYTYVEKV